MTAPRLADAILVIQTALGDAGIEATADGSRIRTPGVWILPRDVSPATLAGDWDYLVDLHLVVPNLDDVRAYEQLDDLVETVAGVFDLADDEPIRPTRVVQASGGEFPAYQFPIQITL